MMIARFRIVGWVAGCAAAALCCYLAAQRVASERLALTKVEREIALVTTENARLQTEIETRSRKGQLERWNVAMFRLGAPAPTQFFESNVKLAAFVEGRMAMDPKNAVVQVAYTPPAAPAAPKIIPVSAPAPAPTPAASMLHQATFVRSKPDRLSAPVEEPLVKVALVRTIKAPPPLADLLDDAPRAKPAKTATKALPALAPSDLGALIAAEGKSPKRVGK